VEGEVRELRKVEVVDTTVFRDAILEHVQIARTEETHKSRNDHGVFVTQISWPGMGTLRDVLSGDDDDGYHTRSALQKL
jgi:hypothetical protein